MNSEITNIAELLALLALDCSRSLFSIQLLVAQAYSVNSAGKYYNIQVLYGAEVLTNIQVLTQYNNMTMDRQGFKPATPVTGGQRCDHYAVNSPTMQSRMMLLILT